MKRRGFAGFAGAMSVAVAGRAFGQRDLPLIAVLVPGTAAQAEQRITLIRLGLRESGLVEGVDYAFALRIADGVLGRLPGLVQELAALKPRLIVSIGVAPVVPRYAPDLPHVFTAIADDPVRMGLVQSFAHPGGHTTGNVLTAMGGEDTMAQKRIGLFRELVPGFRRLGFIAMGNDFALVEFAALRRVADGLGFEVTHRPIKGVDDIEAGIAAIAADGVDALYVSGEPQMFTQIRRVAPAVVATGKPSVSTYAEWARAGFLMAYSSDLADGFRRAGAYAARVLRGENPGDIPVEQASKFLLVLNVRTAQQLGVRVPPTFLPDEVVE